MKRPELPVYLQSAMALGKQIFGNQSEYKLRFNKEKDNCWYIDFPGWPFSHHNLMMVRGADSLCSYLSDETSNHTIATVSVIPSNQEEEHHGYAKLIRQTCSLTGGGTYKVTGLSGFDRDIWLCPVTLFVIGEFPKYIYIKKQ